MLHRMALRVLPSLSLAVTEESVRRRKRLVMFVPGLVAFGVYRAAKHIVGLDEPAALLAVSGLVACVTALAAYRVGRGTSWHELLREDGNRLLTWIAGWIGFVYGVQLSLLVLGLLWLVGYDYLQHPDGPAMMAIIISCTAVARDAFEIGHVRRIGLLGRPFPTFPDGAALRNLLGNRASELRWWVGGGIIVGAVGAVSGYFLDGERAAVLVQLAAVTVLCGAVALCAFFGGRRPRRPWIGSLFETKPQELLKYWWWPGLAFASTYYIVTAGTVIFLFRQPGVSTSYAALNGGLVGALMALYGYYLGFRRQVEEEQGRSVPEALLRCPFVMGILGKTANAGTTVVAPASKG